MTATTTAPTIESNHALEFLVTKEHRRFVEFAAAVREHRYIGVCYGPPGVGKTVSARRYTDWDRIGPWLEGDHFGHIDAPGDAHAVLYTPTTFVTARQLDEDLGTLCWTLGYAIHHRRDDPAHPASPEQHVQLVIVDEADRLKTSTLEQPRDFFDRRALGLILIGMPGIGKPGAWRPPAFDARVAVAVYSSPNMMAGVEISALGAHRPRTRSPSSQPPGLVHDADTAARLRPEHVRRPDAAARPGPEPRSGAGGRQPRPRRRRSNLLALAALACLAERPMHPYEMATTMRARGKHHSIKLNYGSLYGVVEALEHAGLVERLESVRDGRRPERTIYRITDAGLVELTDWESDLLGVPVKEYSSFEAGLSLLPTIAPDEAAALLRGRCGQLEANLAAERGVLAACAESGLPRLLTVELEYRVRMREAELDWTRTLAGEIESCALEGVDWWRGIHR